MKTKQINKGFSFINLFLSCILFFQVIVLSSCTVYYTNKTNSQLIEQNIDLSKIQFYNSKKIILQRIDTTLTTSDSKLSVTTTTNVTLNKIVIKKNTPAVCDSATQSEIYIRFEDGDLNYFVFVPENEENPESKFLIGAELWSNDLGLTPYSGENYYIQSKSVDASLKVKKRFIENFLVNKRLLKGLRIDQN